MVSLVFMVLALLGVVEFTWWVPFVESIVASIVYSLRKGDGADGLIGSIISDVLMGVAAYSACVLFAGLNVSNWWVLASPIVFLVAFFFPGGITILNLVLQHFGLMDPPIWLLIVGGVCDLWAIYAVWTIVKERRKG